ncbi:hypothetical protein LguiB_005347 [Lonicera macranthoides]
MTDLRYWQAYDPFNKMTGSCREKKDEIGERTLKGASTPSKDLIPFVCAYRRGVVFSTLGGQQQKDLIQVHYNPDLSPQGWVPRGPPRWCRVCHIAGSLYMDQAPTTTRKRPYRSNEASGSQCGATPSTAPTRPPKYPGSKEPFSKQPCGSEARPSKTPNKRTLTKRVNPTTGVVSDTRSKTPTKEPVASATRSKATKNLGLTRAWQIQFMCSQSGFFVVCSKATKATDQ